MTSASLPVYIVRWHYGPLPTTLLETLIWLTVALYIAMLWSEKRRPAARTAYDIPIALFLIAGLIGIVAAPDHLRAAGIYRAYFIEATAVYYVAVDVLRTSEDIRRWFAVVAIGAAVYAFGEIVLFIYVFLHHALLLGAAPAFLNTSPNADAMYLEPLLAFAAAFVAFPSVRRERYAAAVVLALLLLATIMTLSRASYLAMATLAIVFVLSLPTARIRAWAIAGIAVLALVVLEVPIIGQRISTLASSASLRTSIYGQALQMLSHRPIFGAGISGFPIRAAPYRPSWQVVELYPHDVWLTTWSEVGLLGVVAFAIIFFGAVWRGFAALPRAADVYRPIIWGSVGSLILFFVHGLFDTPFWKNDLSVEFFLIIALQVVALRAVGRRSPSGGVTSRPQSLEL